MVTRIVPLTTTRPIVEQDATLSVEAREWTQAITDQAIIIGTGSPEGAIEANQTGLFMNDAGTTGSILYIKRDADILGDTTKGWVLV